MKSVWMGCLAGLLIAVAGCGSSSSCKDGCDKLISCNINSSGFSCDSSCQGQDGTCAACVNSTSCSDIAANKCAPACPQATFTPK